MRRDKVILGLAILTVFVLLLAHPSVPEAVAGLPVSLPAPPTTSAPHIVPVVVPTLDRATLKTIDPWALTPGAPVDNGDTAISMLAHVGPEGAVVYTKPGGVVLGLLPAVTLSDATVTPVLASSSSGTWLRVMLPSRRTMPADGDPNGPTGWINAADTAELTPVRVSVRIDLGSRTLTILDSAGAATFKTEIAVGAPRSPSPVGRGYLASRWAEERSVTPRVAALSMHSATLAEYRDDPAVTAIHTYRGATRGAISNGCLRIPDTAWAAVEALPIGTPVLITKG